MPNRADDHILTVDRVQHAVVPDPRRPPSAKTSAKFLSDCFVVESESVDRRRHRLA
jgi:hypothetical protein